MGQLLYNLLNSSAFWVVMVICFIVLVVWKDRWMGVFIRTTNLLKKRSVFTEDPDPENVPTYPRKLFEEIALGFRSALTEPLTKIIGALHSGLSKLVKIIFDSNHPFRLVGYVVLFGLFLALVYSDAVAIANTLLVLHITTQIPPFLNNFDIAIFAGSLTALILGFVYLFETMGTNSELTSTSDREPKIRKFMFAYALLICLLSITSLVAWGLARFSVVQNYKSSILDNFVTFVVVFVIPFNSALAAALIFNEAVRGLVVLISGIGYIVEGISYVLNWVLTILGTLVPFLVDVIYRLLHVCVDIILWVITTPILALFVPFIAIYRMIVGSENAPENIHQPTDQKERPRLITSSSETDRSVRSKKN